MPLGGSLRDVQHLSDLLVVVSINDVKVEHLLTHFRKIPDHAFKVLRIKSLVGLIEVHEGKRQAVVKGFDELMLVLVLFSEFVNECVDRHALGPGLKGHIVLVLIQAGQDLEKGQIQQRGCVVLVLLVAQADTHQKTIAETMQLVLSLSFLPPTGGDQFFVDHFRHRYSDP